MKKVIAVVVFLFVVAGVDVFGQTIVSPRTFATYYGFKNGNIDFENEYTLDLEDKDDKVFGSIEGDLRIIDTAKEWFLAMACGTSQIKVTDVSMAAKIEAVLPSKDKQKRGLQAGFVVYQDLVIAKFLGNTATRSKYEGWLKFICDNNGVKPEEVEAFYRNNIRSLISEAVDEEFNKIVFMVNINPSTSYNCVLIRSANNQYVLSYESYFGTDTKSKKELTALTLEALLSTMRNSGDFVPSAIDTVKAQAALIPAVKLSDAALNDIKTYLTAFYTNPTVETYTTMMEVYRLYEVQEAASRDRFYGMLRNAYYYSISNVNLELAKKVQSDSGKQTSIATLTREQQARLVGLRR